jgi:hypothetical protein
MFSDWRGIGDGASTFPDGRAGALSMRKKSRCSWPWAILPWCWSHDFPNCTSCSSGCFRPVVPTESISIIGLIFCTWLATVDRLSKLTPNAERCAEWGRDLLNPKGGLVHVAIADPGLIQSVELRSGTSVQFNTALGAKTTALIEPDRLFVFSPLHKGILDLMGA